MPLDTIALCLFRRIRSGPIAASTSREFLNRDKHVAEQFGTGIVALQNDWHSRRVANSVRIVRPRPRNYTRILQMSGTAHLLRTVTNDLQPVPESVFGYLEAPQDS